MVGYISAAFAAGDDVVEPRAGRVGGRSFVGGLTLDCARGVVVIIVAFGIGEPGVLVVGKGACRPVRESARALVYAVVVEVYLEFGAVDELAVCKHDGARFVLIGEVETRAGVHDYGGAVERGGDALSEAVHIGIADVYAADFGHLDGHDVRSRVERVVVHADADVLFGLALDADEIVEVVGYLNGDFVHRPA